MHANSISLTSPRQRLHAATLQARFLVLPSKHSAFRRNGLIWKQVCEPPFRYTTCVLHIQITLRGETLYQHAHQILIHLFA